MEHRPAFGVLALEENMNSFERSGLAARSDLQAPGYDELFSELETVQRDFLSALPSFRTGSHPALEDDTLHRWSRIWEYPYVLHHLRAERRRFAHRPRVIDFGSGSTFFPFAVARLDAEVVCFDNQAVVVDDLREAAKVAFCGDGAVEVRQNGERLPLQTAEADFGYSISVLEHMSDPVPIVAELARVLKPGALFALTLDLDIEGTIAVPPARYERLRRELESSFEWCYTDRTIHPQDVLTTKNSPRGEAIRQGLLFRDKAGRLRPLIGGPSAGVLTVYGCVLRRRL
jgi:SAM-dependent methyltransferase